MAAPLLPHQFQGLAKVAPKLLEQAEAVQEELT
jgi:hypothetical protein